MFAWSPKSHQLLASSALEDTTLKIVQLNSDRVSCKITTKTRFNTIAWGSTNHQKPHGIIAAGKGQGILELWDPFAIMNNKSEEECLVMNNMTHTNKINSLDFNPFQVNLLGSAGNQSEVYIWDLNHPQTPYTPGTRSSKMDIIHSIAWNGQVQHILSTASTNGNTVIWDLRSKKEIMALPRQPNSIYSIVWHPHIGTQIMTASDDTMSLWDLRHVQSAEKVLKGHSETILNMSWCRQDPDLFLSAGRDGRVICWNPNSGESQGEVKRYKNGVSEAHWCPSQPQFLASASSDGPIDIHSIKSLDLKTAPRWLRRPIGTTFSPNDKWVTFQNKSVHIRTLVIDTDILKRSEQFESATSDLASVEAFLEDRIRVSDKEDWKVLRTLFSDNAREELIRHLGFQKEQMVAAAQSLKRPEKITSPPTMSALFEAPSQPHSFFSQVNPLPLFEGKDPTDRSIMEAIVLGDFETAVDLCLASERFSDALVVGSCGGPELLRKVQDIYVERHATGRTYLHLLKHLLDQDLNSIVQHASLDHWQSVLAILCTFAAPTEFVFSTEHLGDRLASAGDVQEALLCYLASGQLTKVSHVWLSQLSQQDDTQLQELVEKVTLFRKAIHYQDQDLTDSSGPYALQGLYQKYCEYAQLMATQGKLKIALKYIQLVPAHFPGRDTLLNSLNTTPYHTASSTMSCTK